MVTLTCRAGVAADVTAIVDLVNRAFLVERFLFDEDRTNEEEVRHRIERGTFLLGERGGALVAAVHVEHRGDRGYIGMLSVDPAAQHRGVGRALMQAAEDHCRQAGCRAIDLAVIDQRLELPDFYRRLGYVEHGTAPYTGAERMKVPCRFILMTKDL